MGIIEISKVHDLMSGGKKVVQGLLLKSSWSASDIIVVVIALAQYLYACSTVNANKDASGKNYIVTATTVCNYLNGAIGVYARRLIKDRNILCHELGCTESAKVINKYILKEAELRKFAASVI